MCVCVFVTANARASLSWQRPRESVGRERETLTLKRVADENLCTRYFFVCAFECGAGEGCGQQQQFRTIDSGRVGCSCSRGAGGAAELGPNEGERLAEASLCCVPS